MGFLRTNDLSEVKNGELNLDFKAWVKTGGVVGCKLKRNKIKCKIKLLEMLGYRVWILGQMRVPRVFSLHWGG